MYQFPVPWFSLISIQATPEVHTVYIDTAGWFVSFLGALLPFCFLLLGPDVY